VLADVLNLRKAGMSVIPVEGKRPLVPWAEFQSRQATEAEIAQWYETWPQAGVGIVTGRISNLVVLDVDGKVEEPQTWVETHTTPTMAVQTPRGGLHLYYAHPGTEVRNTAHTFEVGGLPCDIRGDGGFVVAPPSPGYKALRYWHRQELWRDPQGQRQAAMALGLDAIDVGGVEELFAPAYPGQRHYSGIRLAGYLLKTCKDEAAAWVQFQQWNARNPEPSTERVLRERFDSIARRERSKPEEVAMAPLIKEDAAPEWLEGAAWARLVADMPQRNGLRLATLPLVDEHKGLCPGDLIAIAARPGTGKTSLVANMFWELGIEKGESAVFFSGDMSESEILQWMTIGRVGKQFYTPQDWHESLRLLTDSRLAIRASGHIVTNSINDVLSKRPDTRYVIVDHFNKLRTESSTRAADLKRAAIEIKSMAKHYGVTFIVLSQLTRMSADKEYVTESDLAESDALIQESDVVYGIGFVGSKETQDPLMATLRVQMVKNRFGPPFIHQECWFHRHSKQFEWLPRGVDWSVVK
jgi:hypothetical protein